MPPADRTVLRRAAIGCALATVAIQLAYPLTGGAVRVGVIIGVVLGLCAFSGLDLLGRLPAWRVGALLGGVWVLALGIEVLGVRTGVPFGRYAYRHTLGPEVSGVPLLVPCAWVMMAWPSAQVARRLTARPWARVLLGGAAMAAWDLFLDPQLVAAGLWSWADPDPHLPGVPTVPLSNLLGWLVAGCVVSAFVQAALPRLRPSTPAVAVYGWTWLGSTVALAAFLGLPAAAGWGALGMGLLGVPLLIRPRRPAAPARHAPALGVR